MQSNFMRRYVSKYQGLGKQLVIENFQPNQAGFRLRYTLNTRKAFPFQKRALRKAINEEIKITDSGWIAILKRILESYGISNLTKNIFKIQEEDISKKTTKTNIISFKKELKTVLLRRIYLLTPLKRRIFSHRLKTNIKANLSET